MAYLALKVLLTVVVVVAVSEIAKRSTFAGGLLASLPLTSLLAIVWLYIDTGDVERVRGLTVSIFWLVLPSLSFFLLLPGLLRRGVAFYPSLAISLVVMLSVYLLMLTALRSFGVSL